MQEKRAARILDRCRDNLNFSSTIGEIKLVRAFWFKSQNQVNDRIEMSIVSYKELPINATL